MSSIAALHCVAPREIEWREVPAPRLEGPGEALVRPRAAVCVGDHYSTLLNRSAALT